MGFGIGSVERGAGEVSAALRFIDGGGGLAATQRLLHRGKSWVLPHTTRVMFCMVFCGFSVNKGAAEDLADQASITGSACDITILDDKIIDVQCSPDAGVLTFENGSPARFGISLVEKGWDGEYLIEEVSLDDKEDAIRQRRVADFIALCESDSICQEATDLVMDSNIDTCLQQGSTADAVSFLEYNGDVLPLGTSGQLISCQDAGNLTVVATIAMGQSASEEYNPDTTFGLLIVARFQIGG